MARTNDALQVELEHTLKNRKANEKYLIELARGGQIAKACDCIAAIMEYTGQMSGLLWAMGYTGPEVKAKIEALDKQ